jgi:hypothetical protein
MSIFGIADGDSIIVNSTLKLIARAGDLRYNSVRMHADNAEALFGPMRIRRIW